MDAAIAEIAARIAPFADQSRSVAQARLEIETIDGRSFAIDIPAGKGHPGNPMTWDDMRAKFDGLVAPRFGNRAPELFELARDLGSGRSIAKLREMVAG